MTENPYVGRLSTRQNDYNNGIFLSQLICLRFHIKITVLVAVQTNLKIQRFKKLDFRES